MISYAPLRDTLWASKLTLYDLERGIGDMALREKLNKGMMLSLRTIDKMCKFLGVGVESIIMYKEGDGKESFSWLRGYEVDWALVYDMLKKKNSNFAEASRKMGKKSSYLGNLSLSKVSSCKVVDELCIVLGCKAENFAKEVWRE